MPIVQRPSHIGAPPPNKHDDDDDQFGKHASSAIGQIVYFLRTRFWKSSRPTRAVLAITTILVATFGSKALMSSRLSPPVVVATTNPESQPAPIVETTTQPIDLEPPKPEPDPIIVRPSEVLEQMGDVLDFWEEAANEVKEANKAEQDRNTFVKYDEWVSVTHAEAHSDKNVTLALSHQDLSAERLERLGELWFLDADAVHRLLKKKHADAHESEAPIVEKVIELLTTLPSEPDRRKEKIEDFLDEKFPTRHIYPQILRRREGK